jgi:hypothetical protein
MRNRLVVCAIVLFGSATLAASGAIFSACGSTAGQQVKDTFEQGLGRAPRYVTGAFQGTLAIGRHRTRTKGKDTTELFVGKLERGRESGWLRSFEGLMPGRPVGSVPFRDDLLVFGVFTGDLAMDLHRLKAGDRQGVFMAKFTPTGRATFLKLPLIAPFVAGPTIVDDGRVVRLSVPYRGDAIVGKEKYSGEGIIELDVDAEGEVVRSRLSGRGGVPTSPAGTAPTRAFLEPGAPRSGYLLAMMQAGTCNRCAVGTPQSDPSCAGCRNNVCPIDPWCCSTGWDRICMDEAMARCPGERCECPHATNQEGNMCHVACDSGSGRGACVTQICGADFYCCSVKWDGQCASAAAQCNPPNP